MYKSRQNKVVHLSVTGDEWPLFPLCVNSHRGAGSIPAISAIWQMLRFPALSTAIATAAGYPCWTRRRVGGIVVIRETTIEKSHVARLIAAHRAPATETSLKHARLARFTRVGYLAKTSRTACSLSRAPASASCVEAGASSFFST